MSPRDHVLRPMVLWEGLQHLGDGTWWEEVRPQKKLLWKRHRILFLSLPLLPGHHEMSSHHRLHTQPQCSASLKTQSNKTTWPWTETFETMNWNKISSFKSYPGYFKRAECTSRWDKPSELWTWFLYGCVEDRWVEKAWPEQKRRHLCTAGSMEGFSHVSLGNLMMQM